MEFLIILFLLYFSGHVLAFLIEGICIVFRWIGEALLDGLYVAWKAAGRIVRIAVPWLGRHARDGLVLLYYIADEFLRGAGEESKEEEETPEEETAGSTPYEAALALLGLSEEHSFAAFKAAYRQAIASAHPDKGGTDEAAQAVNAARDVIARRHGWR